MKLLYMKPTLWGQKKLGCTLEKISTFYQIFFQSVQYSWNENEN